MSFLNPLFLIALLTAAIPLLIYLLNVRKPKKVLFSTLAFFDSLKQSALKRIRIKRFLLLAVRILAILMLVIAAARPYLPSGFGTASEGEPKAIVILIDNSPSMEQVDQDGPYFDQAVKLAEELIEMADPDDRFMLNVTNGESLSAPFVSPDGALARISGVQVANKGNYTEERLRESVRRLQQVQEPNRYIYFITDAQATQLQQVAEGDPVENEDIQLQLFTLGTADPSNTGIEGVELETVTEGETEHVRLRSSVKNYGINRAQNQFLSFIVDGELVSQQPIDLSPNSSGEFLFRVPASDRSNIPVELQIEGDELTFDNRFFAAVQLPDVRNIAVITEQDDNAGFQSYLTPMLEVMNQDLERFDVTFYTINQLQASELASYDAVVLDGVQSIPDYLSQAVLDLVQGGGGALLMPAADGSIDSYNRLLGFGNSGRYGDVIGSYGSFDVIDRMAVPELGHPIIDTIFEKPEDEEVRLNVPEIFYYYQIEQGSGGDSFSILSTRTGNSFLQENRVGNGRMIYSAVGSDPGWSNFPVKPFFAPLFFRTVEYLAHGEGPSLNIHTLGEPFRAVIPEPVEDASITKDEESVNPEVQQRFDGTMLRYDGIEWTPGWLFLTADGNKRLHSVNRDAMESALNSLDNSEAEELMRKVIGNVNVIQADSDRETLHTELASASFGKEIWFWFIIAAIILLMAESMISRFYKVETMVMK